MKAVKRDLRGRRTIVRRRAPDGRMAIVRDSAHPTATARVTPPRVGIFGGAA
jgi:hypothetical protein